jgi:hypothetical protein
MITAHFFESAGERERSDGKYYTDDTCQPMLMYVQVPYLPTLDDSASMCIKRCCYTCTSPVQVKRGRPAGVGPARMRLVDFGAATLTPRLAKARLIRWTMDCMPPSGRDLRLSCTVTKVQPAARHAKISSFIEIFSRPDLIRMKISTHSQPWSDFSGIDSLYPIKFPMVESPYCSLDHISQGSRRDGVAGASITQRQPALAMAS